METHPKKKKQYQQERKIFAFIRSTKCDYVRLPKEKKRWRRREKAKTFTD